MRVIDLQRVCSVVGIAFPFLPRDPGERNPKSITLEQIHSPWQVGKMNLWISRWDFVEPVSVWSFLEVVWSQKPLAWDRCTWPPLSKGPGHFERHFDRSSAGWTQVAAFDLVRVCPKKKSSEDWSCSLQEGDILGLLASNWVVICHPARSHHSNPAELSEVSQVSRLVFIDFFLC